MYVILCIIPYRHRGKGDINEQILREAAAENAENVNVI
jgi:hypothetical protein